MSNNGLGFLGRLSASGRLLPRAWSVGLPFFEEPASKVMKDLVDLGDFKKLDLHVGRIIEAEKIGGSKNLLVLKIGLGQVQDGDESETCEYLRQVVAGLGTDYDPEFLVGKQVVVLVNLKPKMIMGIESQGMLIAVDDGGRPVLLLPEKEVKEGSVLS